MSPSVQVTFFSSGEVSDDSFESRPHKGKSLISSLDEYVSVHVHTTGLSIKNDEIIEIAALHIKDGQIVNSFSSLCNSDSYIDDEVYKITGISNDMLEKAPDIGNVMLAFIDFVGDLPVVGQKIVQYGGNLIYDACLRYANIIFRNDFVDTLRLTLNTLSHLSDKGFTATLEHFALERAEPHRALSDATSVFQLYEKLKPFIVADQALPESCAFGGYTYDHVYQAVRRMVNNPGDTLSMTVNQKFATIFMFKKKAFSVVLNAKSQYIESDKSIAFEHVASIPGARQLKNTARFPIASTKETVPAIEAMIRSLYDYFADRQTNFSMMLCCNDFVRCSDAKECLHKDSEDYAGCRYRRNLEAGRIFYGKNANAGALAQSSAADDSTT